MRSTPLQEKIAKRAYEMYEARGKQDGAQMDDWLKAEQEILAQESSFNQKRTTLKSAPVKNRRRPAN